MLLAYPENLSTSNLAYFLAAPTLTYQARLSMEARGLGLGMVATTAHAHLPRALS